MGSLLGWREIDELDHSAPVYLSALINEVLLDDIKSLIADVDDLSGVLNELVNQIVAGEGALDALESEFGAVSLPAEE